MNNATVSFYDGFARLYPMVDVFLKPQKKVLLEELNRLPPGNLLEVGVGNGAHLGNYGRHKVIGIDTSAAMLEAAKRKRNANVTLIQMNGESLRFENGEFDYVVLSHVVAVADSPDRIVREAFRVLRSGGLLFVLNHFTPDNWLKYVDQVFSALSSRFHFRSVFYIESIPAIGDFEMVREISFGSLGYFRLLIYRKP